MVELKCDRRRIEPDIQRVEHGTGHGDGEMHLVHRRNVRQHRRDGVADADTLAGKIRSKALAALMRLAPGEAAPLVDRADVIGIDRGAACEKAQRAQRHVIGGRLVEADIVLLLPLAHRHLPYAPAYRNPMEIHGNTATTINPTSSASR